MEFNGRACLSALLLHSAGNDYNLLGFRIYALRRGFAPAFFTSKACFMIAQKLREASSIAEKEGVPLKYVLWMMEIESRRATTLLIERAYEEIRSINQLLQEMKQVETLK